MYSKRFTLTPGSDETRQAQQTLLEAIEKSDYDAATCFAVRLALEEALTNAFKHGNKNDPAKIVTLECVVNRDRIVLDIEDQGEGFDPTAVPDPTEEENLEIPAGRGIVLMKSFMTDVHFEPPGNRVRMTFSRTAD